MAYTYSAWASQSTTAAKLTMLQLHISEVSAQMGLDVSADGKSVSRSTLRVYLKDLQDEKRILMSLPDATGAVNGGTSFADFGRGEN